MTSLPSLALLAFCAAASPPDQRQEKLPPLPKNVDIDELADGTDVVVVNVPGGQVSVRLVIRSGGDEDPPGRAGLAHLLEHLIFHGTYQEGEGAFFQKAWGAGADLNALTSSNWTTYLLDARASAFDELVPSFLTMVTSPALPFAELEREKGVVGAEQALRPSELSVMFAFDQQAFPSANGGVTVIGTDKSREQITIDDIERWYALHYVPENAVLVVVGDVTVEQVRRAATAGLKWPPKIGAPVRQDDETPNAPSQAKAGSLLTVTIQGHALSQGWAGSGGCDAAAGLLELRLRKRVVVEQRMIADVGSFCHRQRGHDFLLAYVVTASPESSTMPDWIKGVVKNAATVPATPAEKATVESRRRALLSRSRGRPDLIADAIMRALLREDWTGRHAVHSVFAPPPLKWTDAPTILKQAADPKNLVELHFSRFEY